MRNPEDYELLRAQMRTPQEQVLLDVWQATGMRAAELLSIQGVDVGVSSDVRVHRSPRTRTLPTLVKRTRKLAKKHQQHAVQGTGPVFPDGRRPQVARLKVPVWFPPARHDATPLVWTGDSDMGLIDHVAHLAGQMRTGVLSLDEAARRLVEVSEGGITYCGARELLDSV